VPGRNSGDFAPSHVITDIEEEHPAVTQYSVYLTPCSAMKLPVSVTPLKSSTAATGQRPS